MIEASRLRGTLEEVTGVQFSADDIAATVDCDPDFGRFVERLVARPADGYGDVQPPETIAERAERVRSEARALLDQAAREGDPVTDSSDEEEA